MVIPVPIVAVLFQRGAFTAADTLPTALAVAIYGAGLPAFVMQKVISPLYYAREDTRSPFRFAVHAMVVNAAVALGLAPFIGFIAAALGTTVAGWVMLWQLWRGTRPMGDIAARRRPPPPGRPAHRRSPACSWAPSSLVAARLLAGPLADPLPPLPRAGRSSSASAWRPTPPPLFATGAHARRRPPRRAAPRRLRPASRPGCSDSAGFDGCASSRDRTRRRPASTRPQRRDRARRAG